MKEDQIRAQFADASIQLQPRSPLSGERDKAERQTEAEAQSEQSEKDTELKSREKYMCIH